MERTWVPLTSQLWHGKLEGKREEWRHQQRGCQLIHNAQAKLLILYVILVHITGYSSFTTWIVNEQRSYKIMEK